MNKAMKTMCDSFADFQNSLGKEQISALEESGFLSLCQLVYRIVHVQLLDEVKLKQQCFE